MAATFEAPLPVHSVLFLFPDQRPGALEEAIDFVIDFDVDAGMVKVEVARTRTLSNGRLVF